MENKNNILPKTIIPEFESDSSILLHGDSLTILPRIKKESIDIIFADPPYFLSNDGITCNGGKMVSVNKGSWDKAISL